MRLRLAGVETHDAAQVAKVEMEATFLQDEPYHVRSASVACRVHLPILRQQLIVFL